MLPVQPVCLPCRDKELAPVSIRPGIGHRQISGARVFDGEALIGKLPAVDARRPRPVAVYEVTALQHEILYDAVEHGAGVPTAVVGFEALRTNCAEVGYLQSANANEELAIRRA